MPILTVFIVFEPVDHVWLVRRAHTVVEVFDSCDQAIRHACEIGVNLRERMHCNLRFVIQGRFGGSHLYLSMNDDRSATTVARRVSRACGSHMQAPRPHLYLHRAYVSRLRATAAPVARLPAGLSACGQP